MPDALLSPSPGRGPALLVTRADAPAERLAAARAALGTDSVLVCGDSEVDLVLARRELEARGLVQVLAEGGPSLLGTLFAAGAVDELDLTWSPGVVGGEHPRIVSGGPLEVALAPVALVESEGTVMGRWRVLAPSDGPVRE
jgi:riboflavin biosynthesis pyrimidine reductase